MLLRVGYIPDLALFLLIMMTLVFAIYGTIQLGKFLMKLIIKWTKPEES